MAGAGVTHAGFYVIAALLGYELLATLCGWQTFSMAWWWLGRHYVLFRWVVSPAFVTWLWFHLVLPSFKGVVR